jgi:hypothetical protein
MLQQTNEVFPVKFQKALSVTTHMGHADLPNISIHFTPCCQVIIVNTNEISRYAAKIMYGPHKERFD